MTAFRDIRRSDRALTEEQAREILTRAEHGVLATVGTDGWPYAVPVNHVLAGDVLYIHCAQEGHKLENIAHEERVSFCAVASARVLPASLSTLYESAIVFGRAAVVTDPDGETTGSGASGRPILRGADARGGKCYRHFGLPNSRGAHPDRTDRRQGSSFW